MAGGDSRGSRRDQGQRRPKFLVHGRRILVDLAQLGPQGLAGLGLLRSRRIDQGDGFHLLYARQRRQKTVEVRAVRIGDDGHGNCFRHGDILSLNKGIGRGVKRLHDLCSL